MPHLVPDDLPDYSEWLTPADVEQIAKRGRVHVSKALRSGALPAAPHPYPNARWRISPEAVREWIAASCPARPPMNVTPQTGRAS